MTERIKSADLKLALKRTFSSPGWQVFYEVGNDTGAMVSRHADAVAIGIWPSNGHLIHGFEIKVSRADFLNEMKDPTKSQAVFQFCDRWSLVTPAGLVKADELPGPWGLMTYDGKSLRTVKQAAVLQPVPLTAGFVAAMLRRAGEADDSLLNAAVQVERARSREVQQKAIQDAIGRDRENRKTSADRSLEELKAYRTIFEGMERYEIEGMAPFIKIAKAFGSPGGYSALRNAVKAIQKAGDELKATLDNIDSFDDLL